MREPYAAPPDNLRVDARRPHLDGAAFDRARDRQTSTAQALASLDKLVGSGTSVLVPGRGEAVREPNAAIDEAKRRGPT
jgi:hypothetical protein